MAQSKPFAFNTGAPLSGTTQIGNLAIGNFGFNINQGYGGLTWYNGPDESVNFVIGFPQSGDTQPLPDGGFGDVQFWRTKTPSDENFIQLAEFLSRKFFTPQTFATADDAKIWLNSNGFFTSFGETPFPTSTPTSTPTPTSTSAPFTGVTPTETSFVVTPTPTESSILVTPTPTPTSTSAPFTGVTPTETSFVVTPTPSVTPESVTGYSFNLVALPYNFPSSGNTIMNGPGGATSGATDPNVLATGSRGLYWNSIDSDGIDRTNYFSGFTGESITITMSQTGSTAVYSGDTSSLKTWTASTDTGFVFGAGIGVPPVGTPSGTAVLIQSASTEWTIGLPVYISVVLNGGTTPTPTPTQTNTPTPTKSSILVTPTPTPSLSS